MDHQAIGQPNSQTAMQPERHNRMNFQFCLREDSNRVAALSDLKSGDGLPLKRRGKPRHVLGCSEREDVRMDAICSSPLKFVTSPAPVLCGSQSVCVMECKPEVNGLTENHQNMERGRTCYQVQLALCAIIRQPQGNNGTRGKHIQQRSDLTLCALRTTLSMRALEALFEPLYESCEQWLLLLLSLPT